MIALVTAMLVTAQLAAVVADDATRQVQFAKGLYARAQWDAAAVELESFLRQHPDHPEAPKAEFYLGETLVQQQRYQEAGRRFLRYLDIQPNGTFRKQVLFRVAECAFLSKLPTAQQHLDAFSRAFPDDRLNGLVLTYRGQVALQREEPRKAEILFRQSLDTFPDAVTQDECRLGLARALEALDRTDEAERYYMALAAKSQNATAIEAKYRLASLRYAQHQYVSALNTFAELDAIPKSSPWAPSVGLGKGWALMKLGRYYDADKAFTQLSDHATVAVQARYWQGLCRKAEKDWTGATEAFLAAAEKLAEQRSHGDANGSAGDVTDTAILFHAGDTQLAAGRLIEARKYFGQAIASGKEGNTWFDNSHRAAVQVSLCLKEYDRARSDAERFLADWPDSCVASDILRLLARAQLEQHEYRAAERTLCRLHEANLDTTDSVEDAYLLALCYQGQHRYETGLQVLQLVFEDATGELAVDARLVEASLLVAMRRYEDALNAVSLHQTIPATKPDRSQALALMAVCHAQLGHGDEAFRLYEEAFQDVQESASLRWDAAEQIAETALNANQYDRAETLYQSLIAADVEDERKRRAMIGLAWVQHGRSDNQSADATLAKLFEMGKGAEASAEARFLRGQVLRELGQLEPARRTFEQLIRDHAQASYARDALWDVAQLYEQLGRRELAVKSYERILSLTPSHNRRADALYSLAWLRHEEGNTEEQAARFRQIFTHHHDSPYWAHSALSLAQYEADSGRQAEAGTILKRLLADEQCKPVRDRALYLSGQMAFATREWQRSRQAFEQLIGECPQSDLLATAAFAAAEAAFHDKDPESLALFEGLLAEPRTLSDEFRATVRMRVAQLYAESGRWDDAMPLVESFADDYPEFAHQYEIDYVRGRCLAARALFAEARQAYESVVRAPTGESTETAAKAQLMIAEAFFHQRRYGEAYRAYMQVEILYGHPELQAAALLQAGKCQELLNSPLNATELYRLILKNHAGTHAAEQAALQLDRET